MRKRMVPAVLLASTAAMPAHGQTIVDTFHQLRSTLKQLGTRPTPPTAPTAGSVTAADPRQSGAAGDQMVPPNLLADDPSDSALEGTPLVQRRTETFDIRGLKLGMSPREFGRIVERQHFRRRWNSILTTSGTFEVEAANLANGRLNRPIEKNSKVQLRKVQGFDPAGDELNCDFALEPDGPKLSRIEYHTKLDGATQQQATAALLRKYGPTIDGRVSGFVLQWSAAAYPNNGGSASMIVTIDTQGMTMTLTQSTDHMLRTRRKLEERAQQLAAAHGGGVKF